MSTSRCDRCIVAGVPCHDCRLRALERAGKGIEPTGRLRVVESENARLRYALRVIADQGDPHNGEVTRRRKDGEPESWASRLAYFTLHPERRRCD